MKTTYLINKQHPDGTVRLSVADRAEWLAVVKANKHLPLERQRYFIRDCISDGSDLDWMIIETTREDYLVWHREQMACTRNRTFAQAFQKLSLDAEITVEDDSSTTLYDVVSDPDCVEEICCNQLLMKDLRKALKEWKPWANEMLDLYLQDQGHSCAEVLSGKYGISKRMIRKYKVQFKNFINNFFSAVPF